MTIAPTLACAALTVEAVAGASWRVLLAAVAAYWAGDVCDGAVALEPSFALPVAVYLLAFVVVDTLLSLTFLAWPLLGVNYLRHIDQRVWRLNFSPPAKLLNSAVFLLLLLARAAVRGGNRRHLRARAQKRLAAADAEDNPRTAVRLPRGLGSGAAVSGLLLVAGVFVLAFVSAFVPLVSIELVLVGAAATGTSGRLLRRTGFVGSARRRNPRRSGSAQRLERFVARAAGRRAAAAGTVFVSAVTGLPPFALVSALAGAWRLRLSSFFVLGLAGRSARFAGVLLVPQLPGL